MRKRFFAFGRWASGALFCLVFAAPAWMTWGVQWLAHDSVKLYFEKKELIVQMQLVRVATGRTFIPVLFVAAAFFCFLDKPKPADLVWRLYLRISGALALVLLAAAIPFDWQEKACLGANAFFGGYTFPYLRQGRLDGLQLTLLLGPALALPYCLLCSGPKASVRPSRSLWISAPWAGAFVAAFALPAWKYRAWVRQLAGDPETESLAREECLRQIWLIVQYGAPVLFALLILSLLWRKTSADSLACWLYFALAAALLLASAASWLPFGEGLSPSRISFFDSVSAYGRQGFGGFAVMLIFGPAACWVSRQMEKRREGR